MEAQNSPRMLYCLAVAQNSFALDGAVLDILNINYNKTILKQAEQRGLIDLNKPYKLIGEKLEKFVVEDFAITDFNENLKLSY